MMKNLTKKLMRALILTCVLVAFSARAEEFPPFKLGLSTQFVAAGFDLIPLPPGLSSNKLTYRPAQSNYAGVILGYYWLGGTVSVAIPAKPAIRDVEGISKYRDYRLSYYSRRFGGEVSYTRYLGFLIDNSSTLSAATLNGQTYYKVPDLETIGFGANVFYVVSPEVFSLPAALDQSDIQAKPAGSAVLVASGRQQSISSDFSIIPAEKKPNFGSDQNLNDASATTIAMGGGYAYNFVSGGFFAAGLIAATLGYEHVHYSLLGIENGTSGLGVNLHGRIGLGINSHWSFVTATVYFDYFVHATQSIQINNSVDGATLSAGVRF